MAWIESHQSLLTHRKTVRAAALLKVDRFKLIGHLHALWWWSLDNAADDGDLGEALPEEIAEAAGWPTRHAQAFVDALTSAGFLEPRGSTLALHNWWNYAGKLNAKRAADRLRKQGSSVELPRNSSGIPAEVAAKSQAPTNQPPQPTNQPTNQPLRSLLNLSPAEVEQVRLKCPNADINGRWREWIDWVEEEREKRMPKQKIPAFIGWLQTAN